MCFTRCRQWFDDMPTGLSSTSTPLTLRLILIVAWTKAAGSVFVFAVGVERLVDQRREVAAARNDFIKAERELGGGAQLQVFREHRTKQAACLVEYFDRTFLIRAKRGDVSSGVGKVLTHLHFGDRDH